MEKSFKIRGMHCKSCVDLIESKVKAMKGVEEIKVNLPENEAAVKFNPEKTSLDSIKSEIRTLGYYLEEDKKRNVSQGMIYGLIPHIGCIFFIVGSVFGSVFLTSLFKPLLMSRYFFYILVLVSFLFATLSSMLYLRKNGLLSLTGIKRKKGYLLGMYGSTAGVNLFLFFVIFPALANISITGQTVKTNTSLVLEVDIPCPGHAALISNELKTIAGVTEINYEQPNVFTVYYTYPASKQEILNLEVFKTYKAKEVGVYY